MRNRSAFDLFVARHAALWAIFAASSIVAARTADAAQIEAIRGKTYTLTGKHGPWMIMVTSLWGTTPEQDQQADKAAHELIYQLRRKGVPAYIYRQDDKIDEIDSVDRMGRPNRKRVTNQHGMIAVLAGNYRHPDDKVAQQTLKFVKKFNPRVDVEWQGKPMQVPLDLNKAFMTRNPMLSPEDMARKSREPLLVKLNSGEHTLFENRGKYTLVVASFYGKSAVKPKNFEKFDEMLHQETQISLDKAGRDSWELMTMLRSRGYDAYVFHERFRSIVTVGAFKSANDPEIARLAEQFKAKEKLNPETKQMVLVAEWIQVPSKRPNAPPLKSWIMDPVPTVMEVPK
ncbi:MAG: hypothetical protein ACM3U2_18685 [Deltaproteobacteria bacterium]